MDDWIAAIDGMSFELWWLILHGRRIWKLYVSATSQVGIKNKKSAYCCNTYPL